ncbi:hypothetical protein CC80DRAFT_270928 [Byssothecium circinans]|uniref:Uncharacterized protein n=1 Tax=Byssothecium circinans TaxID=147558 RepID=A0A6A5TFI9_9PLEO|nr:hypothetical protein CC80DRAFT_270928 [Byssothecium circinans]
MATRSGRDMVQCGTYVVEVVEAWSYLWAMWRRGEALMRVTEECACEMMGGTLMYLLSTAPFLHTCCTGFQLVPSPVDQIVGICAIPCSTSQHGFWRACGKTAVGLAIASFQTHPGSSTTCPTGHGPCNACSISRSLVSPQQSARRGSLAVGRRLDMAVREEAPR